MQTLQPFEFNLKTKTRFGKNISLDLGRYLKEFSYKKIGIIIDSAIVDLPIFKKILKKIDKENFHTIIVWEYDLGFEPDYDSLDTVRKEFINDKGKPLVDCFVGIGGGSVMDFSKGLATLVNNPEPAITYRGFPKDINPSLPTIAVPTTAGTGSEVTYNAVFIEKKTKTKLGINTMDNFPILAVLDPTLTVSCPKTVTVSTGMDGLVHTMESYVAVKANEVTRVFARKAFGLFFNNLPKIVKDLKNIELRAHLLLGSYLAGISLMNSGAGPAGGLSYLLGGHFNVPHGIAGAVFLPHIIAHNVKHGYDYSELYDLIVDADKSLEAKKKNTIFSQKFFELCRELGIPTSLREFGVYKTNVDILIKESEKLGGVYALNPIPFSIEDGKNLLRKMV